MLRDPFGPILARDGVVILDGGLATQLEAQGNDLSDALWSARLLVEDPDEIVAAHLAYYRAGARVATTASYQATFEGFAARGIDTTEARRLLLLSVELADRARTAFRSERTGAEPGADPGPLLVAASIGPYGAMLADGSEYRGRYGLSVARLREFHGARFEVLASSGADVLACETIPELEEAVALVELLDASPEAVAWLSFSCADGSRLRSGAPIEEAIAVADASERVVAVGVNCTAPEHVEELLSRAAGVTRKPLVAYPNSGEGWDAARRAWTPGSAGRPAWTPATSGSAVTPGSEAGSDDASSGAAGRWVAQGARIVGGCCRVTPDRIAQLAATLPRAAAPARERAAPP